MKFAATWMEPNDAFYYKGHTEDKYHSFSTNRGTLSRSLWITHCLEACLAHREHSRSKHWASLVVQWIRICLPIQGTQFRSLVWKDPTCRRATKPVHHNY